MTQSGGAENNSSSVTLYNFQKSGGKGWGGSAGPGNFKSCPQCPFVLQAQNSGYQSLLML